MNQESEKEVQIEIMGVPPTVNRLWHTYRGQTYLSGAAKAFYGFVKLAAAGKRMPDAWKYCDVSIVVYPRERRGDADNRIKTVLDGLTKSGFWADDDVVARVSCQFGEPHNIGKTIVRVREAKSKYPFMDADAVIEEPQKTRKSKKERKE